MMDKDKIIDDIQTSALDNSTPVEQELAVEQQEHIENADTQQEPVCEHLVFRGCRREDTDFLKIYNYA